MINIFAVLLAALFAITGSIAISSLNLLYLALCGVLLFLLHSIGLSREWGSLTHFIRRATAISAFLVSLLAVSSLIISAEILTTLARIICWGLLSLSIIIPKVLDTILALLSTKFMKAWPGFSEGLILHRNGLPLLTNEFLFGLRCAQKQCKNGFTERLRSFPLLASTLVFRMPFLSANLLATTYVSRFHVKDVSLLKPTSLSCIMYLCAGTTCFLMLLIWR